MRNLIVPSSRTLRHRTAAWVLAAGLAMGLGGPALADQEVVVRWTHPAPSSVDGFRIHTRSGGAGYGIGTDVGVPPIGQDGRYAASITLPEGVPVYIRLSAYNGAGGSPQSERENEYLLVLDPLGKPGRPELVIE